MDIPNGIYDGILGAWPPRARILRSSEIHLETVTRQYASMIARQTVLMETYAVMSSIILICGEVFVY